MGFNAQINAGGVSADNVIKTNVEAESGWLLLGEYEFKGTDDENVKAIIGANIRSTTVKFVPVK